MSRILIVDYLNLYSKYCETHNGIDFKYIKTRDIEKETSDFFDWFFLYIKKKANVNDRMYFVVKRLPTKIINPDEYEKIFVDILNKSSFDIKFIIIDSYFK